MKKLIIIFIAILLIILFVKLGSNTSTNTANPIQNKNNSETLETKENNEGTVAIVVTPLNLKGVSSTWNFEIVLDTHSEVLDSDLIAVSEVLDDQGKIYKPISWEGDGPEGHHRKGILKFNVIPSKPKSVELKIKNVGGVAERRFKWNL